VNEVLPAKFNVLAAPDDRSARHRRRARSRNPLARPSEPTDRPIVLRC